MDNLDFAVFREFDPETDYNCVLSDWAKSMKNSEFAGVCPNNEWHRLMKMVLDGVLDRGAEIVVAVSDEDRDHILGWTCYERSLSGVSVVHYVFVKDDFREDHGIGKALLGIAAQGYFVYTCSTHDARYLTKGRKCKFVPGIIRRKNLEPVYAGGEKKK